MLTIQQMPQIKTTPNKYFHQILSIVHGFHPYKSLSNTELQVLGELMKFRHLGYKPIITTATRKQIIANLELHPQTLSNAIISLRKKEFVIDDNLSEKIVVNYLQNFNFEFYED